MSADQSREVIRQFFATIDRQDLDALDQLCAPQYQLHFSGVPVPLDTAGAKQLFGAFLAAFSGIRHGIEDMVAEENKVSTRLSITGKHEGDFQGLPPTGRDVTILAHNFFHLRDGRIVEHWVQVDSMGLMQQLGAIPGAAQG